MSWGIAVPATEQAALDDTLTEAVAAWDKRQQDAGLPPLTHTPETAEQIAAATAACLGLAHSGALGTGPVAGSISGHANPGHQPPAGWSGDMISVTLARTPDPLEQPPGG